MRLYNQDRDEKVSAAIILLTESEARELRDAIEELLADPTEPGDHIHVNSDDYQTEITVSIYDVNNLHGFHPRMKTLILEDK